MSTVTTIEAADFSKLPDEFEIEIKDHDFVLLPFSRSRDFVFAWKALKSEAIKRGYTVGEWEDHSSMTHRAKFKRA